MILITGATGFVGSHIVEKLRVRGEAVRCLVRPATDPRRLPAGVETTSADLTTGRGLDRALDGAEIVLHVAGITKALAPADYFTANARATEVLARAVAGRAIRFVYVSSLAAVGPATEGHPVDENTPPHPVSTYGRSKLQGEKIARSLLPDAVIIRPPVVYGPRDTGVFQILKSVVRGFVVEIAGGDRWFSAIYVEDLAEGVCAAARAPQTAARTYFLAHPDAVSWRRIRRHCRRRIMGRRPRTVRVPVAAANSIAFLAKYGRNLRGILLSSRERRSRKLVAGFGPVTLRALPRTSVSKRQRRSPRAWPKP